MVRFPIRFLSCNQYIILAYHCDSNTILVNTFNSKNDHHCIAAYKSVIIRLRQRDHMVDLQVLDKESIQE